MKCFYHERDSHWNNKGAALAGDALMTALDKEHTDYTQESYEECVDFTGISMRCSTRWH